MASDWKTSTIRYLFRSIRLQQVENAPKFPRPSEGENQFTNGFQNLTNQHSSAVHYFWQFLILERKVIQNTAIVAAKSILGEHRVDKISPCYHSVKDNTVIMARRSRRDSTEVSCVIKYLVFGFNIIFWVSRLCLFSSLSFPDQQTQWTEMSCLIFQRKTWRKDKSKHTVVMLNQ